MSKNFGTFQDSVSQDFEDCKFQFLHSRNFQDPCKPMQTHVTEMADFHERQVIRTSQLLGW